MFLYVHKYPPARPSEANFALPEPARSPKSQKKPGSSLPEARKLEARTSLVIPLNSEESLCNTAIIVKSMMQFLLMLWDGDLFCNRLKTEGSLEIHIISWQHIL